MNPESKNEDEVPMAVGPSPPWIELPADITASILQRLGPQDILEGAEYVCTAWRRICSDPSIWRVLHISHADFVNEGIPNLLRRAVDRSQGQLVDLSIEDFGDDNLLNYVVDRSSDLKRLTLEDCFRITGRAVFGAVNKLPHLEELHLIGLPKIEASDIVNIGNVCPGLKSFTFTQYLNEYDLKFINQLSNRNECAVAIAKHMPNLCHLRLISNIINNEGVEAILDGCPNLDSLDLFKCRELDLGGALCKRCSEQIKHLETPPNPACYILSVLKGGLRVGEITDWIADLGLDDSDDDYGTYDYDEAYEYAHERGYDAAYY